VVLEEGSVGSHAAIVARALAIPLVIHAEPHHLRGAERRPDPGRWRSGRRASAPRGNRRRAFRDKIAMQAEAQSAMPACATCPRPTLRHHDQLHMNAGLMADLPSLDGSGAEGVGLFRTELQFLTRTRVPRGRTGGALRPRDGCAKGKPVMFRTLDIGSDKVLPYMKPQDEPNPAMGWRAIRVGLDKRGVCGCSCRR
jgi:phosphotransferase system enzyme I (PtsP)